jgi:hypothetical protein
MEDAMSKLPDCGHGHVHPGKYTARCGGPGLCTLCSRDAAALVNSQRLQDAVVKAAMKLHHLTGGLTGASYLDEACAALARATDE